MRLLWRVFWLLRVQLQMRDQQLLLAASGWTGRTHHSAMGLGCHHAGRVKLDKKIRLIMTKPFVTGDLTATRRNIASAATPAGAGGAGGSRPRSSKKAPDPPLTDEAGFDFPELVLRNPRPILTMYTPSSDTCRRCPFGTSRLEG